MRPCLVPPRPHRAVSLLAPPPRPRPRRKRRTTTPTVPLPLRSDLLLLPRPTRSLAVAQRRARPSRQRSPLGHRLRPRRLRRLRPPPARERLPPRSRLAAAEQLLPVALPRSALVVLPRRRPPLRQLRQLRRSRSEPRLPPPVRFRLRLQPQEASRSAGRPRARWVRRSRPLRPPDPSTVEEEASPLVRLRLLLLLLRPRRGSRSAPPLPRVRSRSVRAVNRVRPEPSRREELLPAGSTLVPPRRRRRAARLRLQVAGCSISDREEEVTTRITRDGRSVRSGGRSGEGGDSLPHITIVACFTRKIHPPRVFAVTSFGGLWIRESVLFTFHSSPGIVARRMAPRGASSLGAPPAAAMAAPAVSV